MLTVDINEDKYPLAVSMAEFGESLGVDKKIVHAAVLNAFHVMDKELAAVVSLALSETFGSAQSEPYST